MTLMYRIRTDINGTRLICIIRILLRDRLVLNRYLKIDIAPCKRNHLLFMASAHHFINIIRLIAVCVPDCRRA